MIFLKRIILALLFTVLPVGLGLKSQLPPHNIGSYPLNQAEWVQHVMQTLTPDERIGQLFMVAAYSNKNQEHQAEIANLIQRYKVGGLIFMQGTPTKQAELTNYFQAISKTPLLIAQDAEWGLEMRLTNTPKFPRQLMLGAIQNNDLIKQMGSEIARECKRIGVHLNFAPVADVNINPNNPVINDRSFGEDKYNVAAKAIAYMQGLENGNVLACAKHFPGHGDTDKDSHESLPTVTHDLSKLYDIDLFPFNQLISNNVSCIMTAHLSVPVLDNTPLNATNTMPATLSKKIMTNLLQKELGFNGLLVTDALNMKGVSSYFEPGVVDVKALLAGSDILLFSQNVAKAIEEIKKAIQQNLITQAEIDQKVEKILKAKFRVGLNNFQPISLQNIDNDLNTPTTQLLIRQLTENALTLARNDQQLIPFNNLENKHFAALAIGATTITPMQAQLIKYAPFKLHTLKYSDSEQQFQQKFQQLKSYNTVVISIQNMSKLGSQNWGLDAKTLSLIRKLNTETKVVLVVFGNPYSLKNFDDLPTLLEAYEDTPNTQNLAAQLLFGAISAKGKLPVTASPQYPVGLGLTTYGGIRLKYTMPEEVGTNLAKLQSIDNIVNNAIAAKAFPGAQVLLAKNGKVFFEKSYGYHTYQNNIPVTNTDLYDLASVTKIAGTMLGLMQLYDNGQLDINTKLGNYLPNLQGTNKSNMIVKDMLLHEAGLKDWIAFYEATIPLRTTLFKTQPDATFSIPVAKGMFMQQSYLNTVWNTINNSELNTKGKYDYSDLGYYYFKQVIENYAQKPFDSYLEDNFYCHLGLNTMCFKPYERFNLRSIPPTENDTKWRNQVVDGFVHDPGSAMLGGVCGHAGLFSDANDLAVIMQMLLNKGSYGGKQFINPSTIELFTRQQHAGNRRGLGFDKPETNKVLINPCSDYASNKTFGHTGFTGTAAWADPENDLIVIFLSNRVYPDKGNFKITKLGVRTKVQDAAYLAFK